MAIAINDFRGVRDFVIAPMTVNVGPDGAITEEYGAVKQLAGVAGIDCAVSESHETKYYDNKPALVDTSEGEDVYTLTLSVPDPELRALIEGKTWDATKKALIGTPNEKKYFAIGFKAGLTNGTEEYYWIYKGMFTTGNKSFQTRDDSAASNGTTYDFVSIQTATEFKLTSGTKSSKFAMIPSTHENAGTFFDTVVTPDKITGAAL